MRYYFDIDNGEHSSVDDTGVECDDREKVRDEAIRVLPAIARDVLPDSDMHRILVKVRDETGTVVYYASLVLSASWIAEPRPADD